jgi:hypothetical protein
MSIERSISATRKAAYSVTEVARLCNISRTRFYDLIRDGVMPMPVYCIYTKRPIYTADLAALCVRVKETNVGIDGRYVIFYTRRAEQPVEAQPSRTRTPARTAADPLTQELSETLRRMGIRSSDAEISAAITTQCLNGPAEATFEADLRAVFDRLRCRNVE